MGDRERALVTGASGFLGARLTRALLAGGLEVRASYRPGDDLRLLAEQPVERRPCDLLDAEATAELCEGCALVLHAAALVSFRPADYDRQMQINVGGTRALLQGARRAGVRRFLYTSTVNTLGVPREWTEGDEHTPFDWAPHRLGYMDSKRAAEDLVLEAAARGELDALAVLPGTMFGPGDLNLNAGTYLIQGARGRLRAAPPGGTSVVHVDDVARGQLAALRLGRSGQTYVLGGENLSYRQLFTLIAEELGVAPPRLTLPKGLLAAAGTAVGWANALRLPLPVSAGTLTAGSVGLYYSSEKARRELGYSFRPAREGIRDAIAWYRSNGVLR
jgi:dihydroflavonol-4-reductase